MALATVATCTVFKQGTGKKGPWTLYKVATTDGQEPTGFDFVQPNEQIDVVQTQNGQYTNLNYTKASVGAAPAAAPAPAAYQPAAAPVAQPAAAPAAPGGDPRTLKIWVAIAEQLGVPKETLTGILDGTL